MRGSARDQVNPWPPPPLTLPMSCATHQVKTCWCVTVTEPQPRDAQLSQRLQELESSMEGLNVRIARLAIGLGVSLQDEQELAHVMSRVPVAAVPVEQRTSQELVLPDRELSGAARRKAHQWEELRGLLVLRYHAETRYVDEVGVLATRQILVEVEAHLERDGFRHGADGLHLSRLFSAD